MSGATPVHLEGQSKPIGRYSPATVHPLSGPASLVCISGQVAVDSGGKVLCPGDARGQAELVFAQLLRLLEAAGGTLANLLSVTIFLADRSHFEAINQVRNAVFREHAPASTLIIAQLMEPGCLIEVNGLAVVPAPPGGIAK